MNEFEPCSASQIDRLVDGELSPAERRTLLMALDQESDGWRRVALAFLESQALRDGMRSALKPLATAPEIPPTPVALTPAPRSALRWQSMVTLAICGLLLFALGRWSKPDNVPAPDTYANNPPDKAKPSEDLAAGPIQQQTLRVELGDGQDVEVPVVENSNLRPEDIMQGPPVIPVSVQRELLRTGRRVYEQRQLYEVTLEDGRRGIVPVSDVLVENAGLNVYQ